MATQTQHFNLTKPDWEDRASISVLNANTDIIDAQMYDNEQSAANAIGNMAAEYDDTATYEVGDFCIYSEVLYKCVTAVTVAEAFDSTKWTQTKAAENFGSGGGGGSATLAGLNDVNLTSPTDGQALVYDGANQKWVNGGVVGSGGGSAKYTEKELWSGTQSSAGSLTLNESIESYQMIIFIYTAQSGDGMEASSVRLVSDVVYGERYHFTFSEYVISDLNYYFSGHFDDATTFTIDERGNTGRAAVTLKKIIGIKWETMQTALIYSEEERVVGVWTDGKPLYQKTVNMGTLAAQNYKTVLFEDVGISNLEHVAYIDIVINDAYNVNFNRPDNVNIEFYSQLTATGIFLRTYSTAVTRAIATIRYTKTTDTAGSGIWTTTGEYAHHYSTTEHVIGTWIDGSPIYEKTYELSSTQAIQGGTWNNTIIPTTGMSRLLAVEAASNMGTCYSGFCGNIDTSYVQILHYRYCEIDNITIRYTKTID